MRRQIPIIFGCVVLVTLGCSDSNAPAPVRITGSWTGTIDLTSIGGGSCPLDPSITEDGSSNVSGTADLDVPCATLTFTVSGTNNSGGKADSVVMTFSHTVGTLIFNGTHDRSGVMMGAISGEGGAACATTVTRN